MKFEEAIKLMREGKKMTNDIYRNGNYFYIDNFERFRFYHKDNNGIECDSNGSLFLRSCSIMSNNWYEYKESILTDKEKTYLENVIRPFKDRVESITKTFMPNDSHYKELNDDYRLDIRVMLYNNDNVGTIIQLPPFDIKSNMYKGMISNKCYTLKELGLFEKEN